MRFAGWGQCGHRTRRLCDHQCHLQRLHFESAHLSCFGQRINDQISSCACRGLKLQISKKIIRIVREGSERKESEKKRQRRVIEEKETNLGPVEARERRRRAAVVSGGVLFVQLRAGFSALHQGVCLCHVFAFHNACTGELARSGYSGLRCG